MALFNRESKSFVVLSKVSFFRTAKGFIRLYFQYRECHLGGGGLTAVRKARDATVRLSRNLLRDSGFLDSWLVFSLVNIKYDEQLYKKTQICHCGDDSIVSGAVVSRAFRARGKATAIDTHCRLCDISLLCYPRGFPVGNFVNGFLAT
ncbi:hypothetical protein Y032_0084g1718 [Ancylostoma ceylanicum]|uniref:Uncharacterized protein n=1 Tax=Ancylostoma ceylanicum TaxID=53326 RepID=A0A016TPR3_9BILA|nr:hypothetical protein Y032_0084g1718 [Ancylostoma ceylanicum]